MKRDFHKVAPDEFPHRILETGRMLYQLQSVAAQTFNTRNSDMILKAIADSFCGITILVFLPLRLFSTVAELL